MNLFVSVGPTIQDHDVRGIVPNACVIPPVCGGSLDDIAWKPGDRLVVIDGYFYSRPSVRHEELLHVMSQGVQVYGAASMGALRAAELSEAGMTGVGAIYEWYKSEHVTGDDEVAVVHEGAEQQYRRSTVSLVSVRWAVTSGVSNIGPLAAASVVRQMRELPFYDRSIGVVHEALTREGVDTQEINRLVNNLVRGRDIKMLDAELALRTAAGPGVHAGSNACDDVPRTTYSSLWSIRRQDSHGVAPVDVLRFAQLFYSEYPVAHAEVMARIGARNSLAAWSPKYAPDWQQPMICRLHLDGVWDDYYRRVSEMKANTAESNRGVGDFGALALVYQRLWDSDPTRIDADLRKRGMYRLRWFQEYGYRYINEAIANVRKRVH